MGKPISSLSYKHTLLLIAYKSERNHSQAQKAIEYELNEKMSMGRHILPYTRNLVEWGLVERTNPEAPRVCGYRHKTTNKGIEEIEAYLEKLDSISKPKPKFGF